MEQKRIGAWVVGLKVGEVVFVPVHIQALLMIRCTLGGGCEDLQALEVLKVVMKRSLYLRSGTVVRVGCWM